MLMFNIQFTIEYLDKYNINIMIKLFWETLVAISALYQPSLINKQTILNDVILFTQPYDGVSNYNCRVSSA